MKAKKILILDKTLTKHGGSGNSMSKIAKSLVSLGYDLSYITLFTHSTEHDIGNIKRYYLKKSSSKNEKNIFERYIHYIFFVVPELNRIIKNEKINLIITSQSEANFVGKVIKLFNKKIKFWMIIRCADSDEFFISKLIKKLDFLADKIIPVSKTIAEDEIKMFPHKDIISIYNPFDLNEINEKKDEKLTDPFEEKLFKENNIIINVGGLRYIKNQLLLIKAFEKLKEKRKNIKLVIIGEGSLRKQLEEYIQKNNLENDVYLLGFRENPFKYVSKADVFVLSSKFEGFGRVLIEAMECGTPIVSANCNAGPSELLDDKLLSETIIEDYKICKWGILVNKDNIVAFSDAIDLVLDNKKLSTNLIKNGYRRAKDFKVENIVKKWEEVLNEI
ncbi:glycosyltransferase [Methanococcus maripaludis]|uniref:Glycosyltransferase involved in cell wall biosynthesis n=1 Tax=Methanococcus maripaludis TaxID=39152 RepID=A0A7J9PAR1_METMI|nr:glycosyltransferase [Methanococcus maripaludis]MBA2859847.1 glycosyltransferase involved in cell wall biosynthesis [Methanococcus maripaludis]